MIRSTPRQVGRFARAGLWVVRDGLRGGGSRVLAIAAINAGGVVTAAVSVGTVLLYANRAARGVPMIVLGRELPTGTSQSVLLVATLAALVGLASAGLLLWAQTLVQHLARDYQRRCMRRLLAVAARPDAEHIVGEHGPRAIPDLVLISSRFSAYALRALVEAILPLLYASLCLAYLLWIDALTTLVLLGLAILYLGPLALVYRGVARRHRAFRDLAPTVSATLRSGIDTLRGSSGPVRDERLWIALLDDPRVRHLQDALYGRLLARSHVTFLNGVFLVLSLFSLFLIAALTGALDTIAWTTILAYIIALRLAWAGMQKVTALLTDVNRFFPDFERLAHVLDAAERRPQPNRSAPGPPTAAAAPPNPIRVGAAGGAAEIAPGEPLLVVTPAGWSLQRTAEALLGAAEPPPDPAPTLLVHDVPRPLAGVRVVDQALGPDAERMALDAWRHRLDTLGVAAEVTATMDGALGPDQAAALSPEAAMSIVGAVCTEAHAALMLQSLRGLEAVSASFQAAWLAALDHHALVLVTVLPHQVFRRRLDRVRSRIRAVLVLDESGAMQSRTLEWLEAQRGERHGAPEAAAEFDDDDFVDE